MQQHPPYFPVLPLSRRNSWLAVCGLTCGVLLVGAAPDARAQGSPAKGTHIENAPSPTTPVQGPPPVSRFGGRFLVGDSAPDIDLRDHAERRFHLAEARREKPWLIVFARTPEDLVEVERALPGATALGVGLVAIAPFHRDRVTPLIADSQVSLLNDGASRTARVYGVFDAVTSNPRPGVFLVDRSGHILWFMSGGIPGSEELTRLTREALERAGQRLPEPPPSIH